MDYEKLTAQQALRIADLESKVVALEEDRLAINKRLYCIGGPLNDNKLGYTIEQLKTFLYISQFCEREACERCDA